MSDYQIKDESGSLFRNKRREKETHPTHKGSAKIAGVEYWISAWVNESKSSGEKYFGLRFEAKEQQPGAQSTAPAQAQESFDDDVPF